jgi:hypothetical protein
VENVLKASRSFSSTTASLATHAQVFKIATRKRQKLHAQRQVFVLLFFFLCCSVAYLTHVLTPEAVDGGHLLGQHRVQTRLYVVALGAAPQDHGKVADTEPGPPEKFN